MVYHIADTYLVLCSNLIDNWYRYHFVLWHFWEMVGKSAQNLVSLSTCYTYVYHILKSHSFCCCCRNHAYGLNKGYVMAHDMRRELGQCKKVLSSFKHLMHNTLQFPFISVHLNGTRFNINVAHCTNWKRITGKLF